MATDLAPVTPSVLAWARRGVGVSIEDAAKRATVPVERLTSWEAGETEPTVAKLRSLADLYLQPLAVFFLPEPPANIEPFRDFRKLPSGTDAAWDRAMHKIYRRALRQQATVSELLEQEGEWRRALLPAFKLADATEAAGETARTALGVSLSDQWAWKRAEKALTGWMEAVESLGVLVLRTSDVPLERMRGFSLSQGDVPVIVVNAQDAHHGQVFTLAHEFAHLMLREGGLCGLFEPDSGAGRQIEAWCNATAGSLLLPRKAMSEHEVLSSPGQRDWSDDDLTDLSERYGVSKEAVLLRLVTLGRASREAYAARRQRYLSVHAERREEERQRRRRNGRGGLPPHRMVMRDQGKPYVRLVLDAYHRDAITLSSLSTLLEMQIKHLPHLEKELGAR
jgi:Zn-dependent peptidase ImmA (M78 family)/transcriptional regulator with XRE-family HTH domain